MNHTREQLDEHLMNTTLKEIRHKTGTKFPVFSDVQFQRDCLESHNKIRREYGAAALTWSQDLADQAQHWAEKLAEKGHLLYSELPGVGENMKFFPTFSASHLPTGQEVTQYWTNEAMQYNYDKPGWQAGSKSFTQIVWKTTKELGVGRAPAPSHNAVVVVAFYRPSGNTNFTGDFDRNVPKLPQS